MYQGYPFTGLLNQDYRDLRVCGSRVLLLLSVFPVQRNLSALTKNSTGFMLRVLQKLGRCQVSSNAEVHHWRMWKSRTCSIWHGLMSGQLYSRRFTGKCYGEFLGCPPLYQQSLIGIIVPPLFDSFFKDSWYKGKQPNLGP